MNIEKFSKETIQQLILLAVESSPTKAALLMLNDGEKQIDPRYKNVIKFINCGQRIEAIRELRTIDDLGLKEAVNTIAVFTDPNNASDPLYSDWNTRVIDNLRVALNS